MLCASNPIRQRIASGALLFALTAPASCSEREVPSDPLAALRGFEAERRASTDFARVPASDAAFGPDPYDIRALPGSTHFVGILRGRGAVVVLDGALHELQRLDAPASPSALAVTPDGDVFVAGDASPRIVRWRADRGRLEQAGYLDLPGVRALRGLAAGPGGVLYAVDEHDARLLTIRLGEADGSGRISYVHDELVVPAGPIRVARVGDRLLVECLLDHMLVVWPLDADALPMVGREHTIRHDGPIWGFDAVDTPDGMLIAAGGVEDHPLDRTGGSFGYIDSFVYLYRLPAAEGPAVRLTSVDVSSLGVVTPKALHLVSLPDARVRLTVTGYGGDRAATLVWRDDLSAPAAVSTRPLPPGTSSIADSADGLVVANPLLDAWIFVGPERAVIAQVPDEAARDASSRIGEALFFTTLVAPWNKTDAELSRFTCETCHFEGYVDGRTHHTGRGDVRATTKPLLGLFNNRPHFSRALDPDLTTMTNAEFQVAGARSGHEPWFTVRIADAPWLASLAPGLDELSPEALRRALMSFLMDFSHRPNPAVAGRTRWTAAESAGARAFGDRCERCHAARLISDDARSRVPFDQWENLVMASEGAIVWGRDGYEKTGIVPYVHERGARVPSLRRLYKKRPYFTNGSARDLPAVLQRARTIDGVFLHAGDDLGERIDEQTCAEILAFLELL